MEDIFNFCMEYDLFSLVFGLISCIFIFIKTKDIKKVKEVFNNMNELKFKKVTYAPQDEQTFTTLKAVYRLNKATGELEKTDEVIDLQELVNSCLDMSLNAVLDKFMPQGETDEETIAYNSMTDDLDEYAKVVSLADTYREKFVLPSDFTVKQVFDFVNEKSKTLKSNLEKVNNKEDKENA